MAMSPVAQLVCAALKKYIETIEEILQADLITIYAPIYPDIEARVNYAVNSRTPARENLAIILQTGGGLSQTA